jgi:hypothetical protein
MSDIQDSMGFGSGTATRVAGTDLVKRRAGDRRGLWNDPSRMPVVGDDGAGPDLEEWET